MKRISALFILSMMVMFFTESLHAADTIESSHFSEAFESGKTAYLKGDFEEALVFLSSITKPDSTALYQLGLVHQAMTHQEIAQQYFEKALQLNKENSSAWAHLGEIFYRKQQYNQAKSALGHALEHERTAYNHYMMGLVLMELSEYDQAIENLSKAGELHFAYQQKAMYSIGVSHVKNHDEKLARQAFQDAIAINPKSYIGVVAGMSLDALD